jgi:ABC-type multidrug transport system ATPase subunit
MEDERMLQALGVWKAYRRGWWPRRRMLPVLKGADVQLGPGEVVGLVGENGSGKSTLMKVLVGDLVADAGTVERTASFGYCPQVPVLYERLTCDEHLDLFGAAYGLGAGELTRSRQELYAELDFVRFAETRVEELSGGTRSKLNLALALLHDPALLFLDEPYAGFDWDTYQRFWELTAQRRDAGASLLIISHFIADEDRFDRIYDLIDGRTVPR